MNDTVTARNDSLREVFLGREPILDKDQALVGYELVFRDGTLGRDASDPRSVTAELVCAAFAQLGLPNVFGRVRAFISVDGEFLAEDSVELLPADTVVFVVDAQDMQQTATAERCRDLKRKAYQFAISNPGAVDAQLRPLLELATYIRVDIRKLPPDQMQHVTSELKTTRRTLIACGVETQPQLELCSLLGFGLFQGYYFAKPDVVEGRTLDTSSRTIFRLLQILASDAEIDEIEKPFRAEPALVANMLRLTNSVGIGARTRISSVRHAITVLGRKQLQRWLQLLLFSAGGRGDLHRNPLMKYAALRAHFMELLIERLHRERRELRDPAFITGLMSVMPAALGMSMTDMLAQIAVDNDVRLALSRREGILGHMLNIVDRYDANDIVGLQAALARYGNGIHLGLLVEVLAESIAWVEQLDTENG